MATATSLIRAYESTHTMTEVDEQKRGKDAYADQLILWMAGRHHGCILSRQCGKTSFADVENGVERGPSRHLYALRFEVGAKGLERDSVSAQLNLQLKQAVCQGCNGASTA